MKGISVRTDICSVITKRGATGDRILMVATGIGRKRTKDVMVVDGDDTQAEHIDIVSDNGWVTEHGTRNYFTYRTSYPYHKKNINI